MIDLPARKRRCHDEAQQIAEASATSHPVRSRASVAWIGAGIAAVGLVTNVVGANKQASAISDANAANQSAQAQQNSGAWGNYLLTRGIAPTTPPTPGVIPSAGQYTAVNSRLPLWANVTSSNGPKRWVKSGTPAPATTLALA